MTTVVGVSGGPDSVALLRLMLCELAAANDGQSKSSREGTDQNVNLIVAHFDHRWRADSEQDQEFVVALAKAHQLTCHVGHAAASDGANTTSEERARAQRYAFLTDVAKHVGARYLAIAHTADDQVETIVHHAVRGTGLRGLGGIRRARALNESLTLMRPLLGFRRDELIAYLRALGQPFRVDPTNTDHRFMRAKIRHELLPLLRDYHPRVDQNLLRLGALATDAQEEITRWAGEQLASAVLEENKQSTVLSREVLRSGSSFLLRETCLQLWRDRGWPLQDMSMEKWAQLAAAIMGGEDRIAMNLPGDILVKMADGKVELARGE